MAYQSPEASFQGLSVCLPLRVPPGEPVAVPPGFRLSPPPGSVVLPDLSWSRFPAGAEGLAGGLDALPFGEADGGGCAVSSVVSPEPS
ncbi:hypothetical protein GCM10009647_045620 [Streptomyces sanglieri]